MIYIMITVVIAIIYGIHYKVVAWGCDGGINGIFNEKRSFSLKKELAEIFIKYL